MKTLFSLSMFFWVIMMALVFLFGGCGESRPIPCVKPAIQIADMSHNYSHCRGLEYE